MKNILLTRIVFFTPLFFRAEAQQLMEDMQYLENLGPLPDVPTTVLTSIRQDENLDQLDRQRWADAHALLGAGLTDFQHILTQRSGHYIQVEEPDLVLSAINELLKE